LTAKIFPSLIAQEAKFMAQKKETEKNKATGEIDLSDLAPPNDPKGGAKPHAPQPPPNPPPKPGH
jgi:hypothetical protein